MTPAIVSLSLDKPRIANHTFKTCFKQIYGIYDILCELLGYKPFLLKDFKVKRGKINHVEVRLEKLP